MDSLPDEVGRVLLGDLVQRPFVFTIQSRAQAGRPAELPFGLTLMIGPGRVVGGESRPTWRSAFPKRLSQQIAHQGNNQSRGEGAKKMSTRR